MKDVMKRLHGISSVLATKAKLESQMKHSRTVAATRAGASSSSSSSAAGTGTATSLECLQRLISAVEAARNSTADEDLELECPPLQSVAQAASSPCVDDSSDEIDAN